MNPCGGEAIETKRFPFWAFEMPPPADRLGEDEKIPKIDRTHKKGVHIRSNHSFLNFN